jgi:DNA invertase Pin-like site-specific DNA recombinase
MNYAYLRISTDSQDVDNQRHGILEYANRQSLTGLNFVEDTVSGKKKWKDRKLGELVDTLWYVALFS